MKTPGPNWSRPPGGGLVPCCTPCQAHLAANPGIWHAAASVGIERGLTTLGAVVQYIGYYHRNGHPATA